MLVSPEVPRMPYHAHLSYYHETGNELIFKMIAIILPQVTGAAKWTEDKGDQQQPNHRSGQEAEENGKYQR